MKHLIRSQRWLAHRWRDLLTLFSRPVRIQPRTTSSVLDVPDRLPRRTAIIVAKDQVSQWLIFDCPCKAGHRVMLNIDPDIKPAWRIISPDPLTLRRHWDAV